MKKNLLVLAFIVGGMFTMSAQSISKNAIGVRLGDSDGFGTEVNYQRAVGTNNNRIELGAGFRSNSSFDAIKLVGLYEWVWNIDGGFNWYVGPGAGVGKIDFDGGRFENDPRFDDDETFAFLAGVAGIEYNFDFPLLLSLDVRPEFGLGDYRDDLDMDIALGVRYQF
ncbi:MAG: hypothetical protein HKM28_02170 [Flavobacteriaceae bacterium]|nr:hypothetical protein [Flavobacteriaceae bacterium]